MTIQLLRNRLEQQKGQQQQIQKSLSSLQQQLQEKTLSLHKHEQAKEIIRAVGLQTQQTLQVNISDITSLALEAVFPDPYELKVEFLQRRNKTECDLYFVRDGNRVDPLTASGVGAVDVAAFALRIASWSMMQPHTRNTIILDEPFRFLSENYQEQAAQMLKQISIKLGIQMIIVTHNETLASSADKVFNVSIRKGISKVQTNN
jgi:predicted ABC-type transport system involved in lysophospholipase L1 biosynthesis ATPase subunit